MNFKCNTPTLWAGGVSASCWAVRRFLLDSSEVQNSKFKMIAHQSAWSFIQCEEISDVLERSEVRTMWHSSGFKSNLQQCAIGAILGSYWWLQVIIWMGKTPPKLPLCWCPSCRGDSEQAEDTRTRLRACLLIQKALPNAFIVLDLVRARRPFWSSRRKYNAILEDRTSATDEYFQTEITNANDVHVR